MTESRARSIADGRALDSLKALAFELIPEPAMVVDREGALVAANEAADKILANFDISVREGSSQNRLR